MSSGNKFANESLLNALLTLKENISNGMHVAEICKVLEVKEDRCLVTMINDDKTRLYAYKIGNVTVNENDLVIVIFTDNDFRINLQNINSGNPIYKVDSKNKHSIEYGIIIGGYSGGSTSPVEDVKVDGNTVVQNAIAQLFTINNNYSDSNKLATKNDIPTKVSELENDSGFITTGTVLRKWS